MGTTTAQLVWRPDRCSTAPAWPWADSSADTRAGYAGDLRTWFAWCAQVGLEAFAVCRAHIELYARWMEEDRRLARATIGRPLPSTEQPASCDGWHAGRAS